MKRYPRPDLPKLFPDDPFQNEDPLFRALFHQAGTGIAVTFLDGRFIKVNSAFCTLLGYSENDLLDRRLENIMAPDQWCRLSELYQDILTGKQGHAQISLVCRHQAGKAIRGLLNLSIVADKEGASCCFLVQIQEISRLMNTETELEENRQRYRALSDATFEAVFISSKGVCIDANRTASIMFDTPREELIGIFGTDVIAPDYQARVREHMLSGYEAPYHAVAVKKDGTRFHVMIQGKMIRIDGSEVRVTVLRDIDAQVAAETALRESERHLRSFMESASNFVLFRLRHRPDTPYQPWRVFISPSIAEIVDPTQVPDFQSWLKMLRPDDRERLLAAGLKMLDTHRLDETVRIHDDTGKRWRWLHIISVAVSDETENSLFFNGIILDITKEMEATAALKAREKELKEKTESLSEVNTALEVLLQKREVDRMEMEEKMLTNAKSLILPYLEKLKASRMDEYQRVYLDLVESNLNEIISPLSRSMSRHFLNFTPSEIQVANLVKQGKTTKDVALILGLSARTIEAVRYTIRRKLGIKKKRSNLRSYLLSIDGSDTISGGSDRIR
ncbi:PAS domain S-box protein [uncultured Desulfosarcina sp.]|uniref:PAS domain S-box protein n=1 Tax=uncultured Desulfosarcina sp. TaxID=218289 RepID=UPI0029C66415|nr:PAS domain S-box protein [uncultured Desulfosarcina sp.]